MILNVRCFVDFIFSNISVFITSVRDRDGYILQKISLRKHQFCRFPATSHAIAGFTSDFHLT